MSLRKLVGFIHPRIAVVLHDLSMAALAWWIAKLLRYELKPEEMKKKRKEEESLVKTQSP